jgi:hypothetical protein
VFAEATADGLPVARGEHTSRGGGYHDYPSLLQVAAWLNDAGLRALEDADSLPTNCGHYHLLAQAPNPPPTAKATRTGLSVARPARPRWPARSTDPATAWSGSSGCGTPTRAQPSQTEGPLVSRAPAVQTWSPPASARCRPSAPRSIRCRQAPCHWA